MSERLKLGVNIDHVASLRQARGALYPSITEAARVCEDAGADGITVHLREDRRHIQDADVYALRKSIRTRLNLELACSPDIIGIALDVVPDEVCVVPEKREELTTEGGLDVVGAGKAMASMVGRFRDKGILVSLFVAPDEEQIKASSDAGAQYVELHTGSYCNLSGDAMKRELEALISAASLAHELGLGVNAGHGINLENLPGILNMPHLDVLNIGHSIVARSVFVGLAEAVSEMRRGMESYGK